MADTVYTHGHQESVLRSHRWRTVENSAGYLLPVLRPGQRVLDLGCGPGTITHDLARRVGPAGHVTGVDAAQDVLRQARAGAEEAGVTNVEFTTGDALALDLPDGSFDVVHAHQLLQHLGDPVAALREMRRVCRTGGVVAARDADYAAMTWFPHFPELDRWQALYGRVARAAGGEPDAGRRLFSWAQHAGFDHVTPTASAWCFATGADRRWWSGLWADRTVGSDFARLAVDGGHATPVALEEIAAAWRAWGELPDAWFAVTHGEILCQG